MITDQKNNGTIKGVYIIGNIKEPNGIIAFATNSKPNWFRRFCTWLFIGWTWMPIAEAKEKRFI